MLVSHAFVESNFCLGYCPGEPNQFVKKVGATLTPNNLTKSYQQNVLDNNRTFKEFKKTNIAWGGGAKDAHQGNKHVNEAP